MDLRFLGFDSPLFATLEHLIDDDLGDAPDAASAAGGKSSSASAAPPSKRYLRDAKAMAATPADVKEYPNSYVFVVDMPGLKCEEIKLQLEDDRVLHVSGIRQRPEEKDAKYVRMERRVGKFMRKFSLPENADVDKISAVCQDGVLTVTVEKLPPPEPKKPKTIEVKIA